jgi:hypothetical protein
VSVQDAGIINGSPLSNPEHGGDDPLWGGVGSHPCHAPSQAIPAVSYLGSTGTGSSGIRGVVGHPGGIHRGCVPGTCLRDRGHLEVPCVESWSHGVL